MIIVNRFFQVIFSTYSSVPCIAKLFFIQFVFSGKSVLSKSVSSASLSLLPDSALSSLLSSSFNLDLRGNLSYQNLFHQPLYQFIQTVFCLAYNLLQSIWIVGEICCIVICFICLFISLSRQFLVLPIIVFSQFGFSRKPFLSFYSSACFKESHVIIVTKCFHVIII